PAGGRGDLDRRRGARRGRRPVGRRPGRGPAARRRRPRRRARAIRPATVPRRLGRRAGVRGEARPRPRPEGRDSGMKIAMVSEHASPLAALGGVDPGGQNVHVAALSAALARRGHEVTVYTRRDDPDLPETVQMLPGVGVVHVPAGPAGPVPKDDLLPFMPAFGTWLGQHWAVTGVPDVVHSHFWMSGVAVL